MQSYAYIIEVLVFWSYNPISYTIEKSLSGWLSGSWVLTLQTLQPPLLSQWSSSLK